MLFAALLLAVTPGAASDAGLLLEGGTVYEAAGARPRRESVLVRGGRIDFVGDARQARARAAGASVVELSGRPVFPGWTDAHGHLAGLGRSLDVAQLRGAADAAEAARRIAASSAALAPGSWAEGRGWDQNSWPGGRYPDARDLDQAVPDRPAMARRVDGHAVWVNSVGLRAGGITATTKDPPGGRILRRPDGSPSGVLVDNAMALIDNASGVGSEPPAQFERRILAAARACARSGLTEVQDASAYGPEQIAALARLADSRQLPIRIYATVSPEPPSLAAAFARGPRIGLGGDFLTVRSVKAYADGALGSRGAALLADYSDEPGNRGLLVTPPASLEALARETREKGWQLWIHAIGDRGNRIALDAYAKAEAAVPKPPPGGERPRIEHAQVIALEDIPRFAKEHVLASIQPTHATSDMAWAEKRVGPERIRGAYAWRRLQQAGARLAGGSDFPVESENPLLGFYAAISRRDSAGNPPGGWRTEEALTRAETLALFTSDAAWAAFEEGRRGRIAPGFEADLTVLSADPMTVSERDVPRVTAVLTVVGGRIAWTSGISGISEGSGH